MSNKTPNFFTYPLKLHVVLSNHDSKILQNNKEHVLQKGQS